MTSCGLLELDEVPLPVDQMQTIVKLLQAPSMFHQLAK